MSEMPLTPEQFAWLMSLPADHPERIAWSGRPEFESFRALYEQFESSPGAESDPEMRKAVAELEHRFRAAGRSEPLIEPPEARPAAQRERPARSWWSIVPRPVFAAAALVIVTIGGVWLAARPRPEVFRGVDSAMIPESRRVAEGLEIRWTAVAGAESYRLSFVDDSMREIAVVEDYRDTRYLLKTSALPPGLEHGADVILQVQPVRAGASMGTTGTSPIRIP